MKTKLKTLFITIGSCALATSIAYPILSLSACAKDARDIEDNDSYQDDNAINYYYVHFTSDDLTQVKFIGETYVRIRENSFFAQVVCPTATCGGLQFLNWAKKDADGKLVEIKPTDKITTDLNVYPVFENQILLSNCVGFTAIEKTKITVLSYSGSTLVDDIPQDLWFTKNYGVNWIDIDDTEKAPDHSVTLEPGENVFFKGDNETFNVGHYPDAGSITTLFAFSGFDGEDGAVNLSGSIMGLVDGASPIEGEPIPNDHCFANMFFDLPDDHTYEPALKYVSSTFLPAMTLKESCYDSLFQNQTSLLSAPELPATTLPNYCYNNLFDGCELLNYVKVAFDNVDLFSDSITLGWLDGVAEEGTIIYNGTTPDTRTGTTIPDGWTIQKAPTPSPTPGQDITITCPETEGKENYKYVDNHPYQFKAVVSGPEGVSQDVTWASTNTSIASVNPSNGVVTGLSPGDCDIVAYSTVDHKVYGSKTITVRDVSKDADCLCIKADANHGDATLSWDYVGAGRLPEFKYSKDGHDWLKLWSGNTVTITKGTTLYVKGNNPDGINNGTEQSHTAFTIGSTSSTNPARVVLSGTAMGLINDARGELTDSIPCDYCFNSLFSGEDEITSIGEGFLPATKLSAGCYQSMFQSCTNLTTVDDDLLPAESLVAADGTEWDYCYDSMFQNCTSLTRTPDLPATVLSEYCYRAMFYNCQKLVKASALPATVATKWCYGHMFQYCYGLAQSGSQIGYISLETLADHCCYIMFYEVNNIYSKNLFNKNSTGGTLIFRTYDDVSPDSCVLAMFRTSNSYYSPDDPLANEYWYYHP